MTGLNQLAVSEWGGPRKQAACQKHIKSAVAELVRGMSLASHEEVFVAVRTAMESLESAMQALGADRDWVCRPPVHWPENGE